MSLAELSTAERLDRARTRSDTMVDHVRALLAMQASNRIVLYTPTLSGQIPQSHAGHAFHQFQRSMYLFELIRLAAMWDGYRKDRESIPTVVKLIDRDDVIAAAVERIRGHYANPGVVHIDAGDATPEQLADIRREIEESQARYAEERAQQAERDLREAIRKCGDVAASNELVALQGLRNAAIAHNLDLPEPVAEDGDPVWRYGGETDLLNVTIELVGALDGALNGTSFDWADARRQYERNAQELWSGCRFDIPNRSRRLSTGD